MKVKLWGAALLVCLLLALASSLVWGARELAVEADPATRQLRQVEAERQTEALRHSHVENQQAESFGAQVQPYVEAALVGLLLVVGLGIVTAVGAGCVWLYNWVLADWRDRRELVRHPGKRWVVSRASVLEDRTLALAGLEVMYAGEEAITRAANPTPVLPDNLRSFAPRYARTERIRSERPSSALGAPLPTQASAASDMARLGARDYTPPPALSVPAGVASDGQIVWWEIPGFNAIVGGSTGQGKTYLMRQWVDWLTRHNSSAALKLEVIDPKRVGFREFNGKPHVTLSTDRETALHALERLEAQMQSRYQELEGRDLDAWTPESGLPFILTFMDELRDVLWTDGAPKLLDALMARSRAAGMSFILATQYPTSEDVPETLKVNALVRVCFRVPDWRASHVILDSVGAEKLDRPGQAIVRLDGPPIRVTVPERLMLPSPTETQLSGTLEAPLQVPATDHPLVVSGQVTRQRVEQVAERLLRLGGEADRTALFKAFSNRIRETELEAALSVLMAEGRVEAFEGEADGGRKPIMSRLIRRLKGD